MPGARKFHATQEYRYTVHYDIWANSMAEAQRIAQGEEPGKVRTGSSKKRKHQRPTVKEVEVK